MLTERCNSVNITELVVCIVPGIGWISCWCKCIGVVTLGCHPERLMDADDFVIQMYGCLATGVALLTILVFSGAGREPRRAECSRRSWFKSNQYLTGCARPLRWH